MLSFLHSWIFHGYIKKRKLIACEGESMKTPLYSCDKAFRIMKIKQDY